MGANQSHGRGFSPHQLRTLIRTLANELPTRVLNLYTHLSAVITGFYTTYGEREDYIANYRPLGCAAREQGSISCRGLFLLSGGLEADGQRERVTVCRERYYAGSNLLISTRLPACCSEYAKVSGTLGRTSHK